MSEAQVDTDEQKAIVEFVKSGKGHLLIDALAGSGKTSTLFKSLPFVPQKSVLMCAFNKPIADELQARMGQAPAGSVWKAATFHSCGLKIVHAHRPRLDIRKEASEDLVNEAALEWEANAAIAGSKVKRCAFNVRRVAVDLLRKMKDTQTARELGMDVIRSLGETYDLFRKLDESEINIAIFVAARAYFNGQDLKSRRSIDFCDMTWLPVALDLAPPSRFQVVFVDEAQDLSFPQLQLVKKLVAPNGRLVMVGDLYQCHPAGTLVEVTGGKRVPIEDVKIGTKVVTYHDCFRGIASQGRAVLEVGKREYAGPMITIEASGECVRVTPNHRVPTRFVNDDKPRWALYLMEYGGTTSRLGCCQLFYDQGFGPSMRARHELASRCWVLDVFEDEDEAKIAETVTAVGFGLTEQVFAEKGQLKERLLKALGDNRDRAIKCLQAFGRMYEHPMYERGEGKHFARHYSFVTQACNLFSGLNQVRTFDGSRDGGSWATTKISRESFRGYVYSLSVEPTEEGLRLYVADRILVHNSIYKWRGAVGTDVWKEMIDVFKAAQLSLTTTFRCSVAAVKAANRIVPQLKAMPTAPEGDEYKCNFQELPKLLRDAAGEGETFVLSRNNADLLHTALYLWKADVGFQLRAGKEIVEPLYDIIDKLDKSSKQRFAASCSTWYQVETGKAEAINASAWADRIEQQYKSLQMMLSYAEPKEFKTILQDILQLSAMSPITLSTVHKVKGLEAERVFLLKHTFARYRYEREIEEATDPWVANRARDRLASIDQEELNLEYVAITRAKRDVIWVDMRGQDTTTLAKLYDVQVVKKPEPADDDLYDRSGEEIMRDAALEREDLEEPEEEKPTGSELSRRFQNIDIPKDKKR
jgi:superfamily I DNA/RNA helicase